MISLKELLFRLINRTAFLHDYPTPIPENADLNDYTDPGIYYCPSDARAQTLTNCPTTIAFFLYVDMGFRPKDVNSEQYRVQTIRPRNGTKYVRSVRSTSSTSYEWVFQTWTNGVTYVANNLTTVDSGYLLDARQGKILDDSKVNRSGDTMTGNLSVTKTGPTVTAQGSAGTTAARFIATSDVGSVDVRAQGSSTTTPAIGLYDITNGHWIVQHTVGADKTFLSQLCPSSTSTNVTWASAVSDAAKTCNLIKIGRLVFISFYCSYSARQTFIPSSNATICTLPTGYRPVAAVSMPAIFMRNASSDGTLTTTTQVGGICTITTGGIIRQSNTSICNAIYFSGVFEAAA